jgi:hypothetical protein
MFALGLLGCPAASGPQPNATYFWLLNKSTIEFGECSDETEFRKSLMPVMITDSSFMVYKISADKKKAVLQSCTMLDVKSCSDSPSGLVFTVAGNEMTLTQESKKMIPNTKCSLQQNETWTIHDNVMTMDFEVSNALSLVDDTTDCDAIETQFKAKAPNKKGIVGCVVQFKLSGVIK